MTRCDNENVSGPSSVAGRLQKSNKQTNNETNKQTSKQKQTNKQTNKETNKGVLFFK